MALPKDFITRTRLLLGEEYNELEKALQTEAPVSIRVNRKKLAANPTAEPVAWCESGYYLPERWSFTFDPLFHCGAYYVQEASSMFLEQAVRSLVTEPVCCLDLCAAPGGKSTLLSSVLPEGSLLVSNEVIRSRSNILAENITKWGNPNSIVLNNDPKEIGQFTHLFDVVVTDVPCSGEGMFRKDTDSTGEWSVNNVQLCASRQRRIIHDIWNALKPGGILIYSTCTYNTEEDEENIQYFVEEFEAEPLFIPVKEAWNITGALRFDNPVYRFLPHKTKGEGFFLAAVRKPEGEIETVRIKDKVKSKDKRNTKNTMPNIKTDHFLLNGKELQQQWMNNSLVLQTEEVGRLFKLFQDKLHILTAGIEIGELKGKDLIPSQALAMSQLLNRESFPNVEIDWDNAIKYLRKEMPVLPDDTPKGFVLLTYQQVPLGFVKHLGNRCNNLYPQEWRIRSGYNPEEVKLFG